MFRRRTPSLSTTAGSLAAAAALVIAAPGSASACTAHVFSGPLVDLSPSTADPFDGAHARLAMLSGSHRTVAILVLRGVDPADAGHRYGAHLHAGPCVAGEPAAAGPHYNVSTATPPVASPQTEVWLDFTVRSRGTALSVAAVPFVPTPGTRSIVIHAMATDDHGTAGARLACLPVVW
jgi:hypothetical protein